MKKKLFNTYTLNSNQQDKAVNRAINTVDVDEIKADLANQKNSFKFRKSWHWFLLKLLNKSYPNRRYGVILMLG